MNILVTGGAGYKGILLVQALAALGHRIRILDVFRCGIDPILCVLGCDSVEVIRRDVRETQPSDVAGFDVVYHLAGISGMPACDADRSSAQSINVDGTRRLCSLLSNDQLLIYASTTSVYGAVGACDEDTQLMPRSTYAQTKLAGERIVMERENSISLRFATIFGVSPAMRNDLLVNYFTWQAVRERCLVVFSGNSRRTFLHISDSARAYVFALEHCKEMRGGTFNVGSAQLNLTKSDIATAIQRQVSFEVFHASSADADVRDFDVSFARLSGLGYKVDHSLDDGIRDLRKLYSLY